MGPDHNRRILVIDDNRAIHEDFRKILSPADSPVALDQMEVELFGETARVPAPAYQVDSAFQGEEAFERVKARLACGERYALAFVDMRMPPGWDGIQTIHKLWSVDPGLEIVVCTAYSDCPWDELIDRFGANDRLLILKKPFDPVEVRQLASALIEKWHLARNSELKTSQLEQMVDAKTEQLQHKLEELTRTQAELSETTSLMRAFLDSAPVFMGVFERLDNDLRFLALNQPLGLLPPSADGEYLVRRDAPAVADELIARFTEVAAAGGKGRFEYDHPSPRGLRRVSVNVTPIVGAPNRFCTIGEDVTERRQMEVALRLQEKMASVGTLAAGVAHEINNPLAFVAGNLDLLAERTAALSPEIAGPLRAVLSEMREGTERVRCIVRDLKMFSRPDEQQGSEAIELQRLLDSCLNMAAHELRNRAQVVRDYSSVPATSGNSTRMGQLFLNLIINAAQAIPEGAAEHNQIRVALRQEGEQLVVEVGDTGGGIAPAILGRIFDAFFTTKPKVGSGLGLAICRSIVGEMKGEISVASEVGRGTTFTVRLPLVPVPVRIEPALPVVLPQSAPIRRRILVIDDELMVSNLVARLLSAHECVVAQTPQRALALIQTESFDVILCDLMMPGMTGMELYAEVERLRPELTPRFAFISGGAFTPETHQFLSRFADRVVDKPIDIQRLRHMVSAIAA